MIWFIMPAIRSSHADHTNNTLVLIVLLQYIPRFYLIFPLSSHIIKTTGVVTKTAWAGAAYNLVLYMLASHVCNETQGFCLVPRFLHSKYTSQVTCLKFLLFTQILGAAWYLLSVERHAMCWKSACRSEFSPMKCRLDYLDCGTLNDVDRRIWEVNTTVFSQCSPDEDVVFNYGIFANAIAKDVVSSRFLQKYFYCLWWGLQNLRFVYICEQLSYLYLCLCFSDCFLNFDMFHL